MKCMPTEAEEGKIPLKYTVLQISLSHSAGQGGRGGGVDVHTLVTASPTTRQGFWSTRQNAVLYLFQLLPQHLHS